MHLMKKVVWSTGSVVDRKNVPAQRAFMEWHRAHLLGLPISECVLDGVSLDEQALFRLNFWIRAWGAWRCSLLPLKDANAVLSRVVECGMARVPVGRSGGGRHARAFDRSMGLVK